jgi:hypothetical protein
MFSTLAVDDPSFTERHWQSLYALMVDLRDHYQNPLYSASWSQLREHTLAYARTHAIYGRFVVLQNEDAVGWVDLRVEPGADGRPVGYLNFDLLHEPPEREFIRVSAVALAALMERHDCERGHVMATASRTSRLAEAWGGTRLNRIDRYRLLRRRANHDLIHQWLVDFPLRFPDLELSFFDTVPERYLDVYIKLFRQFIDEMPKEREDAIPWMLDAGLIRRQEATRKQVRAHLYTVALLDSRGQMIGHSNGFISEEQPRDMYQAMTGIVRTWRGHGLSRWLKAALFERVGKDFPANEALITDMRAVNEPILAVNAQMGYELLSRGHEYLLRREALSQTAAG